MLERLIFILKSHLKIDLRSVRVLGQNLKYVHVEYDISEGITAAKLKKTRFKRINIEASCILYTCSCYCD